MFLSVADTDYVSPTLFMSMPQRADKLPVWAELMDQGNTAIHVSHRIILN